MLKGGPAVEDGVTLQLRILVGFIPDDELLADKEGIHVQGKTGMRCERDSSRELVFGDQRNFFTAIRAGTKHGIRNGRREGAIEIA